ncbi:H-type lectin domain-containing protein [Rhodovulum bhavnagarense]|uniref:H-type lectin domain-containing protein n=1 Tax=Rhodovulum bhavnagarense TaxID=992286 RepID=A0A4R2RH92_9RHOB|nr:H-type lectin domain-containing protein [Rhodovulum bhavnagarense]TCP63070.1 H-type lectin domain-containing protein [Rhodovulum bhavnagarense]
MKKIEGRLLGIDQGSVLMFSDFETGGIMWTGTGPRVSRRKIAFSEAYGVPPAVWVGISMWDLDQKTNQRADIQAERITCEGFELVFRTWADTRVARIRADWIAMGPVTGPDDWQLY